MYEYVVVVVVSEVEEKHRRAKRGEMERELG